jgi:hypothetical protein
MGRFLMRSVPLLSLWFKGGQNMGANSVFEALGCPFWPSPPAPLPHAGAG